MIIEVALRQFWVGKYCTIRHRLAWKERLIPKPYIVPYVKYSMKSCGANDDEKTPTAHRRTPRVVVMRKPIFLSKRAASGLAKQLRPMLTDPTHPVKRGKNRGEHACYDGIVFRFTTEILDYQLLLSATHISSQLNTLTKYSFIFVMSVSLWQAFDQEECNKIS